MSTGLIIGLVTTVIVVVIIVGLIVFFVMSEAKSKSATNKKSTNKRMIDKKKAIIPSPPPPKPVPKSTLYHLCEKNSDCSNNEECNISRMYYINEFDPDIGADDLAGSRLKPFPVELLEQRKWSVTDVLDFQDNLIVATDSKSIVVRNEDTTRVISTNIVVNEMAAYQDMLLALSGGKVYQIPFATFYHAKWEFEQIDEINNYGDVKYIEASRDRSGLFVGADRLRLYVNGVMESDTDYIRTVFGNEPGQYADLCQDDVVVYPNNTTLPNGGTGVFTSDNRFFKISDMNKRWIRRLRLVSDEPMAISQKVCVKRGTTAQDISVI